jgi:hypothetical protein
LLLQAERAKSDAERILWEEVKTRMAA